MSDGGCSCLRGQPESDRGGGCVSVATVSRGQQVLSDRDSWCLMAAAGVCLTRLASVCLMGEVGVCLRGEEGV